MFLDASTFAHLCASTMTAQPATTSWTCRTLRLIFFLHSGQSLACTLRSDSLQARLSAADRAVGHHLFVLNAWESALDRRTQRMDLSALCPISLCFLLQLRHLRFSLCQELGDGSHWRNITHEGGPWKMDWTRRHDMEQSDPAACCSLVSSFGSAGGCRRLKACLTLTMCLHGDQTPSKLQSTFPTSLAC